MNTAYKIVVNWSNAGNMFIAYVPELSGCIADGHSFSEAVENAEIVMDEWIASIRLSGRPLPLPRHTLAYS